MTIQVLMPALSPTMTEGTLARWLKQEGDEIAPGDAIAEVETDKATMEVEAVEEGTLGKILVPDGTEGVPVNQPIALLLEDGEEASALEDFDLSRIGGAPATPQAPADELVDTAKEPAAAPPVAEKGVRRPGEPAMPAEQPPAAQAPAGPAGRIFASPLAKRMAADAGYDLAQIKGTGPRGRIV